MTWMPWSWVMTVSQIRRWIEGSICPRVGTRVPCSTGPAQGEIDPAVAQQGVMVRFQGQHAVMAQPRRAAPYDHVAMCQRHAQLSIGSLQATEQEYRRNAQRDRHDRLAQITLVAILMQAQARTCLVAIDQTGVRHEAGKAGMRGGGPGQLQESRRHRRPRLADERVERIVAIAAPIADPAQRPRIG